LVDPPAAGAPSADDDRWARLSDEDVSLADDVLAGLGSGTAGLLITFEGVDGSGKSTQLALLADELRARGHDVVVTREPGGTALGEGIRHALLHAGHDDMSPRAEVLLYTAARAQLVEEVIRPALGLGKVVLCDRFLDSSLAYQGYGRELGADNIMMLNVWATDCLFPDLTLVLMVDEATRRARCPGEGDRLEQSGDEFFARVSEGYQRLASDHPHRIRAVDGQGTVPEVQARVRALVDEELGLLR
jgi:dTMP kinase